MTECKTVNNTRKKRMKKMNKKRNFKLKVRNLKSIPRYYIFSSQFFENNTLSILYIHSRNSSCILYKLKSKYVKESKLNS